MSYIGQTPTVGNFQACDAISATATDTFNLLVGGVAISPQSAQHCLISLNDFVAGYFNTTSAIDAMDFKMSSGNVDSGTISLYGIT